MLDMKVFDKIYYPPFSDEWNKELGCRHKGHDVLLTENLRKAGYKIFVDTDVDCSHMGRIHVNKLFVEAWHGADMDKAIHDKLKEFTRRPAWWNESWGRSRSMKTVRDYTEVWHILRDHNVIPRGSDVGDIGFGDGCIMGLLMRENDCRVVGYDYSPVAIKYAKERNFPAEYHNILKGPTLSKHDYVICSHLLEHMLDGEIKTCIKNVVSSAKKQAIFIVPEEKHLGLEHARFFNEETLRSILEPFVKNIVRVFKLKPSKRTQRHIDQGTINQEETFKYRHIIAVCDV